MCGKDLPGLQRMELQTSHEAQTAVAWRAVFVCKATAERAKQLWRQRRVTVSFRGHSRADSTDNGSPCAASCGTGPLSRAQHGNTPCVRWPEAWGSRSLPRARVSASASGGHQRLGVQRAAAPRRCTCTSAVQASGTSATGITHEHTSATVYLASASGYRRWAPYMGNTSGRRQRQSQHSRNEAGLCPGCNMIHTAALAGFARSAKINTWVQRQPLGRCTETAAKAAPASAATLVRQMVARRGGAERGLSVERGILASRVGGVVTGAIAPVWRGGLRTGTRRC